MRYAALICFFVLQVLFCQHAMKTLPQLGIVPPLPSEKEIAALSFGDRQLYFRGLVLNLQMSGDTFGRSTPLKDYDYPLLLEWFRMLDRLDAKSNSIPSIAAYYFSRSQDVSDVNYVLDYLEEHSLKDPEHNWWWMSQAIYLSNHVLGDKQRAIRIAHELGRVKEDIPAWARQMEAFLHEDLGDKRQATRIMCESFETMRKAKDIPEKELDFMLYFFKQRMGISDTDDSEDVEKKLQKIVDICYERI